MKKILTIALMSLAMLLSCHQNQANAATQTVKAPGVIYVRTSATKEVSPNVANITFTVETTNKSVSVANSENKVTTTKVVSALKSKLVTNNGDIIQTANYQVQPNYVYSQKDKKSKIVSYTVINSVDVKLRNVEKTGSIIDTALAAGANKVDSLNFSIDNEQSVYNDLYPQVVKNAQVQASVIARALNMSLAGVKSINTNSNVQYSSSNANVRMYSTAKTAVADTLSTPVETGKIKVEASVSAEFYVQ